jgi:hypothetical protein
MYYLLTEFSTILLHFLLIILLNKYIFLSRGAKKSTPVLAGVDY